MSSKVSILINNYNYSSFLVEAVESVFNQSYPHKEIIIVDDGSTDDSQKVLEQYSDRVTIIFKTNGGQASTFNIGFEESSGEFIYFLDADDYFYPSKVKIIIDLFNSHPEIDWIFHELEYINAQNQKINIDNSSNIKTEQVVDLRSIFRTGGKLKYKAPCGICFRRSLLEQILPMPQAQGVSISDVYLRTAAMILSPGLHSPQKLAVQRIHDHNTFTFRKDVNLLKSEITIKTSYYLWQKFSEEIFDRYMHKAFIRSLAQSFAWIGIKKTFAFPESKLYFQEYFSVIQFVRYTPRLFAYLIKFLLEKDKE